MLPQQENHFPYHCLRFLVTQLIRFRYINIFKLIIVLIASDYICVYVWNELLLKKNCQSVGKEPVQSIISIFLKRRITLSALRAHLRSAARGHLTTPRTRTRRFGPRSFRVSGPTVWNSLLEDIANPELSLEHFKTGLKTHLFRLAYAYSSAHSAYVTWLRGAW